MFFLYFVQPVTIVIVVEQRIGDHMDEESPREGFNPIQFTIVCKQIFPLMKDYKTETELLDTGYVLKRIKII